jgi:chromatin segregation and condensation protein Rec8/ScpA/Scc1 (kleisin family)
LNPEALAEAFSKVYEALQRIAMETETMEEAVVSLEEKMRDIAERLRGLEAVSLHSLSGTRARAELVIIFIAVLHLAREGRVALAQSEQFSDIIVSGTGVA